MKSSAMTIGQVADRFGLPTHVLRHWESVGLLSPTRVRGDRRRYGRDDLVRVASIVHAKQAGLSLPEIRAFLAARDPAARKDVLRRSHRALQERMAALRSALDLLEAGLNCSHEEIATCPNYQARVFELSRGRESSPVSPADPDCDADRSTRRNPRRSATVGG